MNIYDHRGEVRSSRKAKPRDLARTAKREILMTQRIRPWDALQAGAESQGVDLMDLLATFSVKCGQCLGDMPISHSDPGEDFR